MSARWSRVAFAIAIGTVALAAWLVLRSRETPLPARPDCGSRCLAPRVSPAAGQPRGVVMVIASSGWDSNTPSVMDALDSGFVDRGIAARWRNRGWQTVVVTHRARTPGSGPGAYVDVVAWYDYWRASVTRDFGASFALCVTGASSGGHLALLLAAQRRVRCTSALAPATDLRATAQYPLGPARAPTAARDETFPPAAGRRRYSPIAHAPSRYPRRRTVLVAATVDDAFVPFEQAMLFGGRRPSRSACRPFGRAVRRPGSGIVTVCMRAGGSRRAPFFVHGVAHREDLRRFHRAECRLAASVSSGSRPQCNRVE